ncbi:RNA polymerase sigma factor [Enhygromyxa salina]|nr:sigma-70 family RNA polymerase sigma factor [Enhygromyxa salina]
MDPDPDQDLELLQRWRDGDKPAGGELLARHFNLLRVYFLKRVPERPTEDLIQEVFVRMVEALDRFEGRCSVRTFLIRIAQNVYRETLRELHRPDGQFDPLSESLFAISGRRQSSIVAQDQAQQLLLDAMQHIPSDQHDMLDLYYFHGFTLREIAELQEIPEGTAKSRIDAARRSLLREFMSLLGSDAEVWTDDALDRGLTRVRDVVIRGQPRA